MELIDEADSSVKKPTDSEYLTNMSASAHILQEQMEKQ